MSVIELIASEWAWLRSEDDRNIEEQRQRGEPRLSPFDVDAVIARYRNL
jgi:hypothetical protein